jgi:hypothetical protein
MYLQVYSEGYPTTASLFPQAFPGVFVADLSAFATPVGHVATITTRPEPGVIVVDLFLEPFATGFVLTIVIVGLLRLPGAALLEQTAKVAYLEINGRENTLSGLIRKMGRVAGDLAATICRPRANPSKLIRETKEELVLSGST